MEEKEIKELLLDTQKEYTNKEIKQMKEHKKNK